MFEIKKTEKISFHNIFFAQEDGPVCVCEDGYTLYEDGKCLKPETEEPTGECDQSGYEWSAYLNSDTPEGLGDWETLAGFAQAGICAQPTSIEARRTDATNTDAMIYHMDPVSFYFEI